MANVVQTRIFWIAGFSSALILAVAGYLLWPQDAHAVPANENLADAIVITTPSPPGIVATGNTSDATFAAESGELTTLTNCQPSSSSVTISRTVWYKWTSPGTGGTAALDTWGSAFDTALAVYVDGPTPGEYPLNLVACNDDRFNQTRSALSFTYAADTTYYIQLGSFSTAGGNSFVLSMSLSGIYYVNSSLDNTNLDLDLTLREAMSLYGALTPSEQGWTLNPGLPGLIHFTANHDINLGTALPVVTSSGLHISGINCCAAGVPEIDGQSIGILNCLAISGNGNAVSGMRIRRCSTGVQVSGGSNRVGGEASALERNVITENPVNGVNMTTANASGNRVLGNYIGTDGVSALANGVGVHAQAGAGSNVIGGTTAAARNVIGFNTTGVRFADSGTGNIASGNYIGVFADGFTNAGNGLGVGVVASGNTVGGSAAGAGNVIAGSGSSGIQIVNGSNNTVQGNYIGLRADGATALANAWGVLINGTSTGNQVGGSAAGARNVIAGNTNEEVLIDGESADANTVAGNYIGLGADGSTTLATAAGVSIGVSIVNGADNNVVGGSVPGAGNVISGFGAGTCSCGVSIFGSSTEFNRVSGNYIGTDATGMLARPNVLGVNLNAVGNDVGGSTTAERNVISGNTTSGIWNITDSNSIGGNYIGVGADGTTAVPNGIGISVSASFTVVGGATVGGRNVISGNTNQGVLISSGLGNIVSGNYIGVAADGVTAVANGAGVVIQGGSDDNIIGGSGPGLGNVISGNNSHGERFGVRITGPGSVGNDVLGNLIGVGADGFTPVPNLQGVVINGAAGANTIGESTTHERNIISGNEDTGVWIDGAGLNSVAGNYIGLDASGIAAVPNDFGVFISGASDGNVIGGSMQSLLSNTISGNTSVGIALAQTAGTNHVRGNFIGSDPTGTSAIGNGSVGISVGNTGGSSRIGSSDPNERNIISGNGTAGVFVALGATSGNLVQGNFIGTSRDGMSAIPNPTGILAYDAGDTFSTNLISGNTGWGMEFDFGNSAVSTLEGNWVGTDASYFGALGNGAGGIRFAQHSVNVVSLSMSGRNTIAFNGGPGINVDGANLGTSGQTIRQQSIHSNAGLGIDLTNGGNANEAAPLIGGINGDIVSGFACPGCVVDVYSDSDGEGRFYHATANANGIGQWSVSVSPIADYITATATDASGNTSEFASFYVAEPCDGVDNDGDTLIDEGNPDTDLDGLANCIDPDDDNDTHADGADGCPLLAEDIDGFDDADGCPEYDNDLDGICDPGTASIACSGSDQGPQCFDPAGTLSCPVVSCANVAEDYDAFHDDDGCPEPDNDNDGRPDAVDTCPGDDSVAGPDGMLGAPQDLNHNGVRDGSEAAFATDDGVLTFEDYDGVLDADGCHDSPGDDFDGDLLTDEFEVFTLGTLPYSPDSDADSHIDGTDNCPLWANVAQNVPAWPIPANDADCDGFSTQLELAIGTDPTRQCPVGGTPDAWPVDFNKSGVVNITDVLALKPVIQQSVPPASSRFDLNASGVINITDVLAIKPFIQQSCTP